MDEFARAFHQADSVFVMDIYAASEKPIEGVTAEALVERIRQFGHRGAEYVGTMDRGIEAMVNGGAAKAISVTDAGRRQRLRRRGTKFSSRLRGKAAKDGARNQEGIREASAGSCGSASPLWSAVGVSDRTGGAQSVQQYVIVDPRFVLSRIPEAAPSRWKACPTLRDQGAARLRAGFRPQHFRCRWRSAAGVCWPSIGWRMPRCRASGRTV